MPDEKTPEYQIVTIHCKDCQFFKDSGEYNFCSFWSVDDEAMTEPDGYCHNAIMSESKR